MRCRSSILGLLRLSDYQPSAAQTEQRIALTPLNTSILESLAIAERSTLGTGHSNGVNQASTLQDTRSGAISHALASSPASRKNALRGLERGNWRVGGAGGLGSSASPDGVATGNGRSAGANGDAGTTVSNILIWDGVDGLAGFLGVIIEVGLEDWAVGQFAGEVGALVDGLLEKGVIASFPAVLEVLREVAKLAANCG